jgi:hypothetical protein
LARIGTTLQQQLLTQTHPAVGQSPICLARWVIIIVPHCFSLMLVMALALLAHGLLLALFLLQKRTLYRLTLLHRLALVFVTRPMPTTQTLCLLEITGQAPQRRTRGWFLPSTNFISLRCIAHLMAQQFTGELKT